MYPLIKRLFDVLASLIALIVLSPLLVILAILVATDSAGPILFRGTRAGRFGLLFRIYKFRTMVANAEKLGGPSTADHDPRITRLGKTLRRYKLDELPQLINILKGEMSLVGPRPEVPQYVALFSEEEKDILTVRPGITDWASIWNPDEGSWLAGCEDPEKMYLERIRPEKIRLQLQYVRKQSFHVDIRILIDTFKIVLRKHRPLPLPDWREGNGEI